MTSEQTSTQDFEGTEISTGVLNRMFLRSLTLESSFNYERQQALGFAYTMIPALKVLYRSDEQRAAALQRHLAFFNTTPYVAPAIAGVSAAVEERQAKDPGLDPNTVDKIKASLMGPLAGIGDSLYWGTFRLIFTGIGTALAMQGNLLGPILFLLGFNLPVQFLSWFYMRQGYRTGTRFLRNLGSGDSMQRLTYGAGILGMLVIGGMTATMVTVHTPLSYTVGDKSTSVQGILDDIVPGLLSLGVFWIIYASLGRGRRVTIILLVIFALGLAGTLLGVLGMPPKS